MNDLNETQSLGQGSLYGLSLELVTLLRDRGWRLAVAESLTGGAICSSIVSVPGASEVLSGGVVAYSAEAKISVLGIDSELVEMKGTVNPDIAAAMAAGVRAKFARFGRDAEIGLATTGVAGPAEVDGKPVGTVFTAVATRLGVVTAAHSFSGNRDQIREASVRASLKQVIMELV